MRDDDVAGESGAQRRGFAILLLPPLGRFELCEEDRLIAPRDLPANLPD
jgi:hypothetical protein